MAIYADSFIFDDKACEEFGLVICSFDGGNAEGKTGGEITFSTSSAPIQNKWMKYGSEYENPLEFSFSVCKIDGSYLDSYDQAAITRWLIRRDSYKKMQFVQCDYDDVWFNAYVTSIDLVGEGFTYGLTINCKCDAPFGYGHKITQKYTTTTANATTFDFIDMSDEIGYCYPDYSITSSASGTITILNAIENRSFYVSNCVANEVITVSGKSQQISTSVTTHDLSNDTNYKFFRIANTYDKRTNRITITGQCIFEFSYYPIRKVGV